ncbi:pentatricopeptide repeat-containing protein, partial [Tanacetum coccineum]
MNTLIRRIIINPKNTKSHLSILKNHLTTSSQQQQQASDQNQTAETITNILKSYPNTLNWKTLNQTLNPYNLKPPTLINKILINLKDPPNAKKALSFFHWSSHFTKTKHQIHTYALLIHILVNAKLIKDASALVQSVLARSVTGGSLSVMLFVNYLISSYEVTDSTPFVFDLVVQICAKFRMINEALDVCFCLSEHGFRLSLISYNTLLHVVQKSDKNVLVWGVYEHMIVNRMDPNDKSVEIMVNALCKEGKLQAFVDMIDRIDGKRCLPRVIVNTCLVFGMVEEGRVEDGLVLLKRMMVKNMISDSVSY